MIRRMLFISVLLLAAVPSTRLRAQNPPVSSFAEPREPEQANAREDTLYDEAKDALDNANYDQAIIKFDQVVKLKGRKADGALYFKSVALSKIGNKGQALTTIAELKKSYPQSKWKADAEILEVELKGTANPDVVLSDEEKITAFQGIMNSDPERGIAFATKWLQGHASPRMKDKVLFVLATCGNEKAQDVLLTVAKTGDPELQKRAIKYVGMSGNQRSRAALKEIYQSSSDVSVKKAIFQGWLMCGCKQEVLAVANTEHSPELRREAIRYLGLMGGRDELRAMYKSTSDPETGAAIIHAMMLCGDTQGLVEIATTAKDPIVLDNAIRTLGLVGGSESLNALTNIYSSHSDVATKKLVIEALFLHGAAKEMVALARKETNPELHRAWMQKLSIMSSPEITDYMMEILNK